LTNLSKNNQGDWDTLPKNEGLVIGNVDDDGGFDCTFASAIVIDLGIIGTIPERQIQQRVVIPLEAELLRLKGDLSIPLVDYEILVIRGKLTHVQILLHLKASLKHLVPSQKFTIDPLPSLEETVKKAKKLIEKILKSD